MHTHWRAYAAAQAVTSTCMSHWLSRWGAADCNGRTNTVALQCARTSALLRQPDNAAFVAQPVHTREELQVAPVAGPDAVYVQQGVDIWDLHRQGWGSTASLRIIITSRAVKVSHYVPPCSPAMAMHRESAGSPHDKCALSHAESAV